jgi:hypothetical protein
MTPTYEHRQHGMLMIGGLGAGAVVVIAIATAAETRTDPVMIVGSAIVVLLALVLLLFSSLTVRVDPEHVALRFGPGLIRKRFRTALILEAVPVRNRWWYGWGIRLTPHGWLFNVNGLDAVELRMADGHSYRIGTDEPDALAGAITAARKARR